MATIEKHFGQGFASGEIFTVLNNFNQMPCGATFTVGSESDSKINVAIQLTDWNGDDLTQAASVIGYLSDDSDGLTIPAASVTTETAIGTDGSLAILETEKVYLLTSEADGDIDIDITDTGTDTYYFVVVLPTGKLAVSSVISFS